MAYKITYMVKVMTCTVSAIYTVYIDCFYRTISKRAKNWIKNSVEVFTKKKLWDKEELPQNDILVIAKLERRLFPNASEDLPSNQKGTGNSIGLRNDTRE